MRSQRNEKKRKKDNLNCGFRYQLLSRNQAKSTFQSFA